MAKGGAGKGAAQHAQQLMAKGYSKTKATQALKDAGNNYQVALRILEQQEAQRFAKEVAKAAQTSAPRTNTASGELQPGEEEEEEDDDYEEARKPVRLHPCIVQYKSCQFGDYCKLRHLPGDVCINYFNGNCIYGDACRRRHVLDGADIRADQRPRIADTFTREDGTQYRLLSSAAGGGVLSAQLVELDGNQDVLQGRVVYTPEASDYNTIRGSQPSHTDPLHLTAANARGAVAYTPGPTPYIEKLKAGVDGKAGPASSTRIPPRVAACPTTLPRPAPQPTSAAARPRKHPCVAQFGSCKYGTGCEHADRDADVCVHFLNGRCRFSEEECHYRHETQEQYAAKLLSQPQGREPVTNISTAGSPTAAKKKNRLQGGGAATEGAGAIAALRSGRTSSRPHATGGLAPNPTCGYEEEEDCSTICTAAPASVGGGWGVWGDAGGDAAVVVSCLPPRNGSEFFPGAADSTDDDGEGGDHGGGGTWEWEVTAGGGGGDSSGDSAADEAMTAAYSPLRDGELQTFLGLVEAFPQEEPPFILQALRSAGGDPVAVADLVGRVEQSTAADIDAVLARALAEEEQADADAEKASRDALERSEGLLTLCTLFPALELGSVEAVYHRCNDSFEEAYEMLLCSQENITRCDYGNVWRGNVSPAEQLRLEKLYGMFPSMHPDIVRSTFGTADKDAKRTIATLNQLSSELLSLRTRAAMGEDAVRWRPHRVSHASDPALPRGTRRLSAVGLLAAAPSEDAVRQLYKAAEAELREDGDWRRVREHAYRLNTCRIRVLSQASAAFLRGDGALARALSREGKELGAEYERLNRLAMLALEMERLKSDAATTLDLHGFHAGEAEEVLRRRVALCRRKRIPHLNIVVGEGHHSRRGQATLYHVVKHHLATDPFLRSVVRLTSVKPGCFETRVTID